MQAQRITNRYRGQQINHLQQFQQKKQLQQQHIAFNKDPQCAEVTYENRIFHVKRKFLLPKYISEIKDIRKRLNTEDDQLLKQKPTREFSGYIDNLQRNKILLRRGAFQIPLQPWFPKKRLKRKLHSQQNQIQIAKQREKTFNIITPKKSAESQNWVKKANSRHRYSNSNSNILHERSSLSNSQRQFTIPKQKGFRSQTFRTKGLSEREESIRRQNQIYRKLGAEIIEYHLLGRLSQP